MCNVQLRRIIRMLGDYVVRSDLTLMFYHQAKNVAVVDKRAQWTLFFSGGGDMEEIDGQWHWHS